MPAVSKQQQKAAGMALSAKRGKMPVSKLKGAAKNMYDNMSAKQLRDYAKTSRKGLPKKKTKSEDIDFIDKVAAMVSEDPDIMANSTTTLSEESNSSRAIRLLRREMDQASVSLEEFLDQLDDFDENIRPASHIHKKIKELKSIISNYIA